jgi:putative transposase
MPRRPRLRLRAVPQHIIQRGNNRQATFSAENDYRFFYLQCLGDATKKYECEIYAYVLMTNHVHLLACANATGEGLSRMMQHVGRRFVRHINRVYSRSGTLWEGRYKAGLVDTEQYFLRCCRYIELNPLRAGMVEAPADYRWSSYRHHAHGIADTLVSLDEQYLRLGRTAQERQHAYRALFTTQLDEQTLGDIRGSVNQGWPLGSERFKDEIERALLRAARPPKRGRPRGGADAVGKSGGPA